MIKPNASIIIIILIDQKLEIKGLTLIGINPKDQGYHKLI